MGKVRTACRMLIVNVEAKRPSLICRQKLDNYIKIVFSHTFISDAHCAFVAIKAYLFTN